MRGDAMSWRQHGGRTWTMELPSGAADWIEVKVADQRGSAAWRVDACLNGSHYRMADAFETPRIRLSDERKHGSFARWRCAVSGVAALAGAGDRRDGRDTA